MGFNDFNETAFFQMMKNHVKTRDFPVRRELNEMLKCDLPFGDFFWLRFPNPLELTVTKVRWPRRPNLQWTRG
jgi:predicted DNA-binding transcriptional regulator AlpA